LSARPPELDRNIAPFLISDLTEALSEGQNIGLEKLGRTCAEKTNYWHRHPLRARTKRPRRRRAAEKRDELATLQLTELHAAGFQTSLRRLGVKTRIPLCQWHVCFTMCGHCSEKTGCVLTRCDLPPVAPRL
jgi:hypothetical protein